MSEPRCGNCRFWNGLAKEPECRAHPPIILVGAVANFSAWPKVKAADWCGEFEARTSTNIPEEASTGFRQNMP